MRQALCIASALVLFCVSFSALYVCLKTSAPYVRGLVGAGMFSVPLLLLWSDFVRSWRAKSEVIDHET
jgi:hypothetical protein